MPLRYRKFRQPSVQSDARIRVAQWVRGFIGDRGISVEVSGNDCGHDACGGSDTIIVLAGGR